MRPFMVFFLAFAALEARAQEQDPGHAGEAFALIHPIAIGEVVRRRRAAIVVRVVPVVLNVAEVPGTVVAFDAVLTRHPIEPVVDRRFDLRKAGRVLRRERVGKACLHTVDRRCVSDDWLL